MSELEPERLERRLIEVEIGLEITEMLGILPNIGPRIRAAVVLRVDALRREEIVLDELEIGVEAQRLVVDVTLPRIRADHQRRNAQAVPVLVDGRRRHMVVE